MENRAHALLAGLFTVVLVAGLVGAVVWLSNKGREPRLPYVLVSRTSIAGLNPQAAVRYRGVEVGRVSAIRFDPKDPRVILIDVGIAPHVPVTTKSFARLGSQGITGLSFIDLDEAPERGVAVKTDWANPARIEMRPSALQEFGDAGQMLLQRVSDIAERLSVLLKEENQSRLANSLASVERMTDRFVTLQERLMPTVDSLPRVTQEAQSTLRDGRELLGEMKALARDLRREAEALDRVGRGAEQIGTAASDLSTQSLPALNGLLSRLTRTAEALERAVEAQTHDPRSLLFGETRPEAGPGEPGFREPKHRRTP